METRDNSSSARVDVNITSSVPDHSSNMRGMLVLRSSDVGGISRNLVRYQERGCGNVHM